MVEYGFCYVDCTGLDLTDTNTQTIDGLYNRCINAMGTNKPIIAANCNWNGTYVSPIHVFGIPTAANEVTFTASTLQVIINSNNEVTINNMVD